MPSSADDPVARALDDAAARIAEAAGAIERKRAVVLIDGRSGAGKTSLAERVAVRWPSAQLVGLDSIYPGWDGMDAGVALARDGILVPLRAGIAGAWRRWDWRHDEPAEEHAVDPGRGLILEGCGLLTPQTALLADVRVWMQVPDDARKARALARDGDTFRPHWDRWAAQEERHINRDAPQRLADLVVRVP